MTEQLANSQDSARYGWQHPPQSANILSVDSVAIRTIHKDVCPECGEPVPSHASSCVACGESLARVAKQIRCMHCHSAASSELVVCPGCGRELRESPSRLLLLGVPALLALLLVIVLVTQWERVSPIAWARANLARGVVLVEDISASIEPEMVIVMTPIVLESSGTTAASTIAIAPVENTVAGDAQAEAQPGSPVTPVPDVNGGQVQESGVLAASVIPASPSGIGGPQIGVGDNDSQADGATASVSVAIAVDDAPELSSGSAPLAADAPAGGGVAASLATAAPTQTPEPTWTVAAVNDGSSQRQAAPSPTSEAVGGVAQVAALTAGESTPTATPTVVLTPLPTPTSTPVVYQIRAGDTLVTIAAQYDVDVEELMAANEISAQEVFAIQPGQMLIVPVATPESVVAVANELTALRLTAPVLLVPPAGATVGCATGGKLIWQRVQFVKDSDKYVLHLGFVSGQDSAGQETVTWVLAQSSPVTNTEWELDRGLCELAPATSGHQWRWWVEVVENEDGVIVSVSPPSEIRGFVWQ